MNSLLCKRRFHQIGKRGRNFLKSRALAQTAKGLLCFVDGKVYTAGLIGGRGPNLITWLLGAIAWAGPQNMGGLRSPHIATFRRDALLARLCIAPCRLLVRLRGAPRRASGSGRIYRCP